MRPRDAALQGAQEIGFTVLSISVSLVAVFIPDPADGRHRRPAVPRVRGHAVGRDRDLDGGVAHHDADDVRALLQPRARGPERRSSDSASARSTGWATATATALGWVLRHPLLMLIVTLATVALNV